MWTAAQEVEWLYQERERFCAAAQASVTVLQSAQALLRCPDPAEGELSVDVIAELLEMAVLTLQPDAEKMAAAQADVKKLYQ